MYESERPLIKKARLVGVRILVIVLMIYLLVMTSVARAVIGDIFSGFYWSSSGYSLFPIPYDPTWFGYGTAPVVVPLTPLELLIYVIFIGYGVWILWMAIGIYYILRPWIPWIPRTHAAYER